MFSRTPQPQYSSSYSEPVQQRLIQIVEDVATHLHKVSDVADGVGIMYPRRSFAFDGRAYWVSHFPYGDTYHLADSPHGAGFTISGTAQSQIATIFKAVDKTLQIQKTAEQLKQLERSSSTPRVMQ